MTEHGAGIIDLGAYSSRPGAADVSEKEEIERIRLAVVSHYGICQQEGVRLLEGLKEAEDLTDLRFICNEAGVDSVKMLSHLRPFGAEIFHLIRIIVAIITGIACLGGQYCGG